MAQRPVPVRTGTTPGSATSAAAVPTPRETVGPAGAAVVGLGIGVLLCLLNVLVLFRTGAGFGGSALVVLLGAVLLRAWGRLTWAQMFIAFSVASSGYFATAALDSGVAAVRVHGAELPPGAVLVVLAVAANLVGVAIGAVVARVYVQREDLAYPTIQPAIALMAAATGTANRRTGVLVGASAAGALLAIVAVLLGWDEGPAIAGLPPYLTVAVSPLLVGVGMLIGVRASWWLAIGGAYSVVVWWLQDRDSVSPVSYDAHLGYPFVLAGGVGVVLGHAMVTLARNRGPLWRAVRIVLPRGRWVMATAGLTAVILALAAVARPEAGRGILLAAVGLVLLVLWVHFLNQAGGEVGIAPISPVLYLSVIALAVLRLPATTTLLVAGAVCGAAMSSLYYTYAVKVAGSAPTGELPPVPRIWWTQALGGTVGGAAGIGLVLLLVTADRTDGSGFPIPIAHALSFVESTAHGSTGYGGDVGLALAAGGVAGVLLGFTAALPTMLGLGILLPPAFTLALAAGGGIRWLAERRLRDAPAEARAGAKEALDHAASGLIIGEGLVMIFYLLYRAFGP